MQTTLETLSQLERRLNVSLPMADIETEVEKRIQKLSRTLKLPGFRPGKIPLRMVAQQYGPQVRGEVLSDKVQASFADAVREQKLRVAGYPRIEPRQAETPDPANFEYTAVFEVYPEVTVGSLEGESISRPVARIEEADVDRTVETLRRQRMTYSAVERGAGQGDRLTLDFTGTIDGVEFPGGQAKDFVIALGDGRMLPEFEVNLPGIKAGETRNFDMTFPADYFGKEVAGKTARFVVTALRVEETKLPAFDEAFARSLGIRDGSTEALRNEIRTNMGLELKRKIEARVKEQVMAALRRKSSLAIPRSLVDLECQDLARRVTEEQRQKGVKEEEIKVDPANFRAQAEERVALGLILADLIRQQGLVARPEQIRALVEEIAQTYERPEEVVKWHYAKAERLKDFEVLAIEGNVVAWALTQAKVVEEPTTFEALMNPAAAGAVNA